MTTIKRLALAALIALTPLSAASVHAEELSVAVTFGPNAEVPDPRAGYNGWTSNQTGVTETLMGIDYDMNLYPRVAEKIEQVDPTKWQVTLRSGIKFHDGTPVTADAVVEAISAISKEGHPGNNARVAKLL
ncbi:MAG: ABC transporter substrate-binding protein, partial [Pseudomonadota bacterium]